MPLGNWQQELVRAIFSAGVSVLTLTLGWLVGQRLTVLWAIRQKRREFELTTLEEFYRLYGEFFAVWKIWNHYKHREGHLKAPDETCWSLLQRAALVDAGVEAILVKVAAERRLGDDVVDDLGLLRQAFQSLRESIKRNQTLNWFYSGHEEYLTFKRLSCAFSTMLLSEHNYESPTPEQAASALTRITSNENERRWEVLREKERAKGRAHP